MAVLVTDRPRYAPGPRLPLGPRTAPEPGCIRAADTSLTHESPIRFGLMRYGKVVGQIELCGVCFRAVAQLQPADPLTAD